FPTLGQACTYRGGVTAGGRGTHMTDLIVPARKQPLEDGNVLRITPESAGWKYVGFSVYKLEAGEILWKQSGDKEVCLLLLTGKGHVKTNKASFSHLGERMSVFEKIPPYSVYVPSDDSYEVEAMTPLEIAVCEAPGRGTYEAR